MAEPVGALRVLMSATAAAFEKDMADARKSVQSSGQAFQASFKKIQNEATEATKKILGVRGALTLLAGATGLYLVASRAIATADAIGEAAQAAGMAAEAFQELQFAATQNGLSQEEYNASIKKFTQILGDAKRGSKAAKELFASMGISDVSKSPDQVLAKLADQFHKIQDPARRASIAMDLFGKSGAAMGNFLALGSERIQQFRDRAQELGIVLSDDVVRGAMEANDELDVMRQVISVGLTNAALQFTPLLKQLAVTVTDRAVLDGLKSVAEILALILKVVQLIVPYIPEIIAGFAAFKAFTLAKGGAAGTLAAGATFLAVHFALRRESTEKATAAQEADNQAMLAGVGASDDLAGSLDKSNDELRKRGSMLAYNTEGMRQLIERHVSFRQGLQELTDQIEIETQIIEQNIDVHSRWGQVWLRNARANQQMKRDLSDTARILEEIRTPTEKYAEEISRINELSTKYGWSQDQVNAAVDQARDRYSSAQNSLEGLAGAGDEMGDILMNAFNNARNGTDSWLGSLKSAGKALAELVLNKAIFNPAADAASGILSSVMGKATDWLSGLSFGTGKAMGGPVFPGTIYPVGENGIEFFSPPTVGKIHNNEKSTGGGGNTYNIDARGASEETVLRLEQTLLRLAGPGVVEKRVANAQTRGKI